MKPITDSFGHPRNDTSESAMPGELRKRIIPPRRFTGPLRSCPHRYVHKKSGPCTAATNVTRGQLPGSGATLLYYYTFPDSGADSSACGQQTARIFRCAVWPPAPGVAAVRVTPEGPATVTLLAGASCRVALARSRACWDGEPLSNNDYVICAEARGSARGSRNDRSRVISSSENTSRVATNPLLSHRPLPNGRQATAGQSKVNTRILSVVSLEATNQRAEPYAGSDLSAPARAAASATLAALSAVVLSIGSAVTRSRR